MAFRITFSAKVSDSDVEHAETQSWLEFALACKYIDQETFDRLQSDSVEVGKLLGFMIRNPKDSSNRPPTYCKQPIADCELHAKNCSLPTPHSPAGQSDCHLRSDVR